MRKEPEPDTLKRMGCGSTTEEFGLWGIRITVLVEGTSLAADNVGQL